jgi:hypothetical protein
MTSVFKGVDLQPLAERFWRLPSLAATKPLPAIRWLAHRRPLTWGTSQPKLQQITMRLSPRVGVEDAAETLLHELVHCALPHRHGETHNAVFRRQLVAACVEAFGMALDSDALLKLPRGDFATKAYAIDAAIIDAMTAARVGEKLRDEAFLRRPPEGGEGKLLEAKL